MVKVNKYLTAYTELTSSEDLRKNNLTLSDYHTIGLVIGEGRALVVSLGVMQWFKKLGAYTENVNGSFLIQL